MFRPCIKNFCSNVILSYDRKYCDQHQCPQKNCLQEALTCIKHTRKCALKTCNERYTVTRQETGYCQKHRCPEPTCNGVNQCQEHAKPCGESGCTLFINKNSTFQFCKPHRCYVKSCLGSHQCSDHFCKGISKYGCNRKKTVEESGCVYCKCPQCNVLKSECKEHCCVACCEPRVEGSKYCYRCTCSVPNCFLYYRKCPHKCRTTSCMSRCSENGFCESRCFFRGESTSDKAKEMLLKMKQDYDKEVQTFELYNKFGFDVVRLDFQTILKRYQEIEFVKAFKRIAAEKIEKTTNYLPKDVVACCVDYCSEDYCKCAYYKPSFDDGFSILKPLNEIFGDYFKLVDDKYVLSETIRGYDELTGKKGKYGWIITKERVDRVANDNIFEDIQCVKIQF